MLYLEDHTVIGVVGTLDGDAGYTPCSCTKIPAKMRQVHGLSAVVRLSRSLPASTLKSILPLFTIICIIYSSKLNENTYVDAHNITLTVKMRNVKITPIVPTINKQILL